MEKVLSRCARKLKPCIMEALKSSGTTLDAYSPVVTTICQTVFETPKVHNVVDTKENEVFFLYIWSSFIVEFQHLYLTNSFDVGQTGFGAFSQGDSF